MLSATIVTKEDELKQINDLNIQNLKQNLSEDQQRTEGFVTWLYPLPLLIQMHRLAPSIIVKDDSALAGYALTTFREASAFHPDLHIMFNDLGSLQYNGKPLFSYRFYCMGQICVSEKHRGQGVVSMLYNKHKEVYASHFDFILTEISTSNERSIRAHEKIGFKTIHTYRDQKDEWIVVVWDWK